jgi:hypothetical protein
MKASRAGSAPAFECCSLVALAMLTFLALTPGGASARCPKIIVYGISNISEPNVALWQTVGADGFFLPDIMRNWQDSVGNDEDSKLYQQAKALQNLFAKHGMPYNFLYSYVHNNRWHPAPVDLNDASALTHIAENYSEAAHLARYAGFKGLAIDLEEHRGLWSPDPGIPDKPRRLYGLGRRIGQAIKAEYPQATVMVLPEVLMFAKGGQSARDFALSPYFWNGFVQAHFHRVVIAPERAYRYSRPDLILKQTSKAYAPNLATNGVSPSTTSIALGLWPLGRFRSRDLFALESPAEFGKRLNNAMAAGEPYVWIYSEGDLWQDPRSLGFRDELRKEKANCSTGPALRPSKGLLP